MAACAAQANPFENGGAGGDAAAPPPKDGGSGTFFDSGSQPPPPDYDTGSPPPPGQDASQPPPPTCTTTLIDDMDHGDNSILKVDGRTGFWYTYNDGTTGGTQTPAIGSFEPTVITGPGLDDAGASDGGADGGVDHAAETAGSGFTNWGAGMGFDLNNQGGNSPKQTYSVSGCGYTGLQFWARVGATSTTAVRLNVPDKNTDPSGGVCAPASKCNDHFGEALTLSTAWTLVTVHWTDLKQQGWGTPQEPALDTGNLVGVQFQFAPSATFELWVADISFTK